MKILAIEDDEIMAEALTTILAQQNYAVEVALNGSIGLALIEAFDYDLIILDVMLPQIDGITLCRQVRSLGYSMPILLLTAQDNHRDKAVGLDAGADDYVVKPFDPEELVARIRALLRRATASAQPLLQWERLQLDPSTFEVTYDHKLLSLTPKECALLELFLRNHQRVFSCGAILEHLWVYEDAPSEEAVRTHIKGLRQKLKAAGANADFIETVYGIGYRLKAIPSSHLPEQIDTQTRTRSASKGATTPQEGSVIAQQTLAMVSGVWHRYQDCINQQIAVLEQAAEAEIDAAMQQQARHEAHSLAGSLGTFGFAQGSRLARQIERLLDRSPIESDDRTQLKAWVRALRTEVDQAAVAPAKSPPTEDDFEDRPIVMILDRTPFDPGIQKLVDQSHLFHIEVVSTLKMAQQKLDRVIPAVVLLNLAVADPNDCFAFLDQLKRRLPPIPAIVLSDQTHLTQRVEVARRGGRFCLHQPATIEAILEAINQVLARSTQAKILVVDDDRKILAVLKSILEPWNLKVIPLIDPQQFWNTLEATSPDLLILDVEMPGLSGIELCQVVRNDLRWSGLPILFLTAHIDATTVTQGFAAGADDFVSKPIVAPELVTRILNRLERIKLLKNIAETDSLTGLLNRHKSSQLLEDFLIRAHQQQQPVAIALLNLKHLSKINHQFGYEAGDLILRQFAEQLRQAFQSEDVVSRWGGVDFLIGMYGMTQDEGVQRLKTVLDLLKQMPIATSEQALSTIAFCAGVAQYPEDGSSVRSLYFAAAAALNLAKRSNRDRIVSTRQQKSLSFRS